MRFVKLNFLKGALAGFVVYFIFFNLVFANTLKLDNLDRFNNQKITPTPTPTPTPIQPPPKLLLIPKLSLSLLVQAISNESYYQSEVDSLMKMIDDPFILTWHHKGVKPGEKGTALIAGHYDDRFGQPAAFYNLKNLLIGDEIIVIDEEDKPIHFQIIDKKEVDYRTLVDDLLVNDGKSYLVLITCSGWWQPNQQTYSHRLVIYAQKVLE